MTTRAANRTGAEQRVEERVERMRPAEARKAREPKGVDSATVERLKPEYDVVVVGAGFAGLTAAKELMAKGWNVKTIEAQNRIGGRALTLMPEQSGFPIPVDMGPAWIHDEKNNKLRVIANELGFHRARTYLKPTVDSLYIDGRKATKVEVAEFEKEEEAYFERMKKAGAKGVDGSAASYLDHKKFAKVIANEEGPLENGVEIQDADSKDTGAFRTGHDEFVAEGFGPFAEAYGKDVPVQLNTKANKISYGDGMVTIDTGNGNTITAKKAIVTVSTGILSSGRIKFEPPLPPETQQAIADKPIAVFDRANMEFKSNMFPGKRNTWIVDAEKGPDGKLKSDVSFIANPRNARNMVVAFFGGDLAKKLETRTDEEVFAFMRKKLSKLLGPKAETDFVKGNVTRWGQSDISLGSFSASRPGQSDAEKRLAKPVGGVLHFRGEATAPPAINGSAEGARHEGVEGAALVDKELRAAGHVPSGTPVIRMKRAAAAQ